MATAFDRIRSKLAALPAALAPQVVKQASLVKVRQVLENDVWQALTELAATEVAGSPTTDGGGQLRTRRLAPAHLIPSGPTSTCNHPSGSQLLLEYLP